MVLFLGVIGLAGLVLWLYCLFDVITTPHHEVRTLPKLGWVAIVVFFFVFGAVAWLLAGRPRELAADPASRAHPSSTEPKPPDPIRQPPPERRPPLGPDDDPEFLRRLKGQGGDGEET